MTALASHEVARVRFRPGVMCGLSLLLVLALLRGIFSGFSNFPSSQKNKIYKFQMDQDSGLAWKPARADVAFSLNIIIFFRDERKSSKVFSW